MSVYLNLTAIFKFPRRYRADKWQFSTLFRPAVYTDAKDTYLVAVLSVRSGRKPISIGAR